MEETEGPASEMNEQVSIQRGISTQSHYWEKPLYESPALGTWEAISSLPNEHDPIGDKNIHMSHYLAAPLRVLFNNVSIFKVLLLLGGPWHVCRC